MNNKKQSSVEWLDVELTSLHFDYLTDQVSNSEFNERKKLIIEQAKAMHMREIVDAYVYGAAYQIDVENALGPIIYYTETFGGQDNE